MMTMWSIILNRCKPQTPTSVWQPELRKRGKSFKSET